MKRAILFSTITDTNSQTILSQIFNNEIKDKVLAYMPSDGVADAATYIEEWRSYAQKFGTSFNLVNNHSPDDAEKAKLLDSNTTEPYVGPVSLVSSDSQPLCDVSGPCDEPINLREWSGITDSEGTVRIPNHDVNSYMLFKLNGVRGGHQLEFYDTSIPESLIVEYDSAETVYPSTDIYKRRYKVLDAASRVPIRGTVIDLRNEKGKSIGTERTNDFGNIFIDTTECVNLSDVKAFAVDGYEEASCLTNSSAFERGLFNHNIEIYLKKK